MDHIIKGLNPEQREAVTTPSRYTQIIAGPGTGKTTTLAAKILYVQTELGINIDKILGISFSRSAKWQLLNKLDDFTDQLGYGGKPLILTFHSLAHRIIKYGIRYNETRFRTGFQRIATEEFITLSPSLLLGLCSEYSDRDLVNRALSQAYNQLRQGSQLHDTLIKNWSEIPKSTTYHIKTYDHGRILLHARDIITFWKRIIKIEKIKNVTDFQGLISEANRILSLKQQTYKHISDSYDYIFVDEYQDTSLAQEELLFLLNNQKHAITVVGDTNQTIYTFNGSNSENMDRFSQNNLKLASSNTELIRLYRNYRSTEEIVKIANDFLDIDEIFSFDRRKGLIPETVETHSIKLAAEYIALKIQNILIKNQINLSDICILYRKNSEFSPQADTVYQELKKHKIPFNRQKLIQEKNDSLIDQVLRLRDDYEDELLCDVIEKLHAKDVNKELILFVKDVMNQGASDTDDLGDFLSEYEEKASPSQEEDSVQVKTVHEAKGQEYPIVFILYLGDREFPHSSTPDIEEERRLLYVGLTRAQNELYIIGQKGIEFEGFLDKCILSNTTHVPFHSSKNEEKNDGFNSEDRQVIDETTRQLELEETKRNEELKKLMNLF